MVSQLIYLILI